MAINDGKKSIPERKVSGPYKDLYLYEYYQEMFSTFSSLEKYMYDTEPIKNNEKSLKEQSYVFGYLDGLHNEITYSQNEDINYNMYELGYETGTNQRKKDDPKQNLNKLKWITFLAINDIKNNIEGRVFNPSTMDIYDTVCEEILIENEQTIQSQNLTEQELMQNHYKKQIKRVKNLDK